MKYIVKEFNYIITETNKKNMLCVKKKTVFDLKKDETKKSK
jgi:hypothetical protein